jgi:4,5:9,10-diseco-3-hydroxy-5,9,17-trioxoandrosta-1(10),2-diene-4-oate hydrolase
MTIILATMNAKAQRLPSIADKFVEIDKLKIAYKDEGSGQVVLCLHALGHSSKDFLSLYSLPNNNFRVISIDFPGHGISDNPKQTISSTYFAKITDEFIEKLDLKNLIIIGNSIGGATAIRIASDNANIRKLVLANPAGLDKKGWLAPQFLNYMIRFFKNGVDKKANFQEKFSKYYNKVLTSDTALARKNEIVKDAYKLAPILVQGWTSFKQAEEDLRSLIETINCPVLFTWGMNDKFVQFGRNKQAIKQFKNYTLIKYKIGHTPYIECPDLFLKDFQSYLNNNEDNRTKR